MLVTDRSDDTDRKALLTAAYRKIEALRTRLSAVENRHGEPVAIVGMGCRFPGGVTDPDSFWRLLSNGLDGTTEIPPDRWNVDDYYDADPEAPNKMYVRRGGFIDNVRGFDPLFFHVSPLEAASMDPQQRVLLEVAWEAIENAGQAPDQLAGSRTGVFVGMSGCDFAVMAVQAMHENAARTHTATGISPSITAGHLSYFFGLRGPCMAIDTACSSALTSIHLAIESLRKGESTMALAGSVNLILSPDGNVIVCKARMLSPEGHCKTFDASANGYARSEGCGVLVLKLLSAAEANGDRILAVIRGSACNQDGRTSGITAPNGNAQREVIQAALAAAQAVPDDIQYIETHGTGTSLGDPIEVQALGEVFGTSRPPDRKLLLGAVKSNIGHLESTAGMAAIGKVILALQKGQIPPNLHFHEPNPHIPWNSLPFTIPTRLTEWAASESERLAGVSAFGFSGTNVHMILQPAPAAKPRALVEDRGRYLLTLSAQTPNALSDLAARYCRFFEERPDEDLGDVCFTANAGRAQFAHRLVVGASTVNEMKDRLEKTIAAPANAEWCLVGRAPSHAPQLGLLIGRMAANDTHRHLFAISPVFRKAFERCETAVRGFLDGASLSDALTSPPLTTELPVAEEIRDKALAFALAYAMAAQWETWGVTPLAVIAYGRDLYVAAVIAGAINLNDALQHVLEPASARARSIAWSPPQIPLISGSTGLQLCAATLVSAADDIHAISATPAGFDAAIEGFRNHGLSLVLCLGESEVANQSTATTEGEPSFIFTGRSDWDGLIEAVARLYIAGIAFDWSAFEAPWSRRRLALPTYPFQRQICWLHNAPKAHAAQSWQKTLHPLLGRRLHAAPFQDELVFQAEFSAEAPALLKDHRYYSTAVVSLTTMLEMAIAGGRICIGTAPMLSDVAIEQPLLLPTGRLRLVQTVFTPAIEGGFTVSILSADTEDLEANPNWHRHCTARVSSALEATGEATLDSVSAKYAHSAEPDWFYETVAKSGVDYGPAFRLLRFIRRGDNGAFAKLSLPQELVGQSAEYAVHPGLLDAAIQALGLSYRFDGGSEADKDVYMPVGVDRLSLWTYGVSEIWCHASIRPAASDETETFVGDVQLFAPDGAIVGEIAGVHFKRNAKRQLQRTMDERRLAAWLYQPRWEALPAAVAAPNLSHRWLVVAADVAIASKFCDTIRNGGGQAILVEGGAEFARHSEDCFSIRSSSDSDYDQMIRSVSSEQPLQAVAYFTSGEFSQARVTDGLPEATRSEVQDLRRFVQALTRNDVVGLQTLALVTSGVRYPRLATDSGVSAGTAWGFGRVIAAELPGLNCKLYDIDPSLVPQVAIDMLVSEVAADSPENQVALTKNGRFGLRLQRADETFTAQDQSSISEIAGAVQLEIGTRGDFRHLRFAPQKIEAPAAGEIQLRILATAMNFRDVLNVLGMYPGNPGALGVECVGEIVAVGPGVEGFALGEHVLAIPHRGYCTYANAAVGMVFRRPANISLAEAATLLVAYLTATYALNQLGHMKAGDRVLIHAAAGGVGLAAVQLAQRVGAEVFATAGSQTKRDYLRQMGVRHVMDSRSLDFVHEIREITSGEGVDLVLNSTTGSAMAESLALVRSGGHFLEIGKTGVYGEEQAKAINPTAHHQVIDLLAPFYDAPELMQALFEDIRRGLAGGALRPLPHRAFPMKQTPQAFKYMSTAKHIGKVVVVDPAAAAAGSLESSGTYLITGGLGGLGLASGLSLAKEGARHLVLVGRRGPGAEATAKIKEIEELGVTVQVALADVSDRSQVKALLDANISPARPLRGIIHAAGLIDDGSLLFQDEARFERVMQPKIDGAWNLHELTLKQPLDFFVLFSSGAGLFGNPGQSSYAAASVFLDQLARARRAAGLPGLSIDWGPWADVGMAARLDARRSKDWNAHGLQLLDPEEGVTVLQMLMGMVDLDHVAVLPVDPGAWRQKISGQSVPPFLASLAESRSAAGADALPGQAAKRLHEADPGTERDILIGIVTEMVIDIFGLGASGLAPDQNLTELGMDSLLAIQLSNRLKTTLAVPVPATLAFNRPTVQDICDYALDALASARLEKQATATSPAPLPESNLNVSATLENAEALLANLDRMSDSEVETLLQTMNTNAQPD